MDRLATLFWKKYATPLYALFVAILMVLGAATLDSCTHKIDPAEPWKHEGNLKPPMRAVLAPEISVPEPQDRGRLDPPS